jgi:hypothetical protein
VHVSCVSTTKARGQRAEDGRPLVFYAEHESVAQPLATRVPQAVWYTPRMARKVTLESLAAIMFKGFASADKKFTALAEDISDIKSMMATKVDITRLDTKIDGVESNLAGKLNRLDTKLTKFE